MSEVTYQRPFYFAKRTAACITLGGLCYAILLLPNSAAADTLSLEDCLRIAFNGSEHSSIARYNRNKAELSMEIIRRSNKLNITSNFQLPSYSDNAFPIYNPVSGTVDLLHQNEIKFGGAVLATQPIYLTGGSIGFQGNLHRRQQVGTNGQVKNDIIGSIGVTVSQPISGPNPYRLEEEELLNQAASWNAQYLFQLSAVELQVWQGYYQLYRALRFEEILLRELRSLNAFHDSGAIGAKKSNLIQLDYCARQLALDHSQALAEIQRARRAFARVLSVNLNDVQISKSPNLFCPRLSVPVTVLIESAETNRPEVIAAQSAITSSENTLERSSSQKAVALTFSGTYGTSNSSNTIDEIINNMNVNRNLAIGLQVPLLDWGVQSLRTEIALEDTYIVKCREQQTRRSIRDEVQNSYDQTMLIFDQLESGVELVRVARSAHKDAMESFSLGLCDFQTLEQFRKAAADAEVRAMDLAISYRLALANLSQRSLYDTINLRPLSTSSYDHYFEH